MQYVCAVEMDMVECSDRSDGFRWSAESKTNGKRHRVKTSIRKGSCSLRSQALGRRGEGRGGRGGREERRACWKPLGFLIAAHPKDQITSTNQCSPYDSLSKTHARKYHRGHHAEGQWVFGGIEEESRKCFMVAVEKRYLHKDEDKLNNCWLLYVKLITCKY